MNLLRTTNALNQQDFLEHFELTLLSILHPRDNSIPAENRMGDTLSLKITNKALYIQHLDRSRMTAMDGGRMRHPSVHGRIYSVSQATDPSSCLGCYKYSIIQTV